MNVVKNDIKKAPGTKVQQRLHLSPFFSASLFVLFPPSSLFGAVFPLFPLNLFPPACLTDIFLPYNRNIRPYFLSYTLHYLEKDISSWINNNNK